MSRAHWADILLQHAKIELPPGEGPFPVVIQLHGCGGLRPFMRFYTAAALARGIAVITVDSLRPRALHGWKSNALVCTGLIFRGPKRAADLYAIYDWAKRQPWSDEDRIAAAGWSHGGWTVMDALASGADARRYCRLTDLPDQPLHGLACAVLIYPYAGYPALTTGRGWGPHKPKVFALVGGRDQVCGEKLPRRALDRLERDGLSVDQLYLTDATHAFEDESPADPRGQFRPDLRDQATRWYAEALSSVFFGK